MITKLLIMRPEQPHESAEHDLPREPGYHKLKEILTPLLDGAPLEHVSVLADFNGGLDFKPADMFVVDEMGHVRAGGPLPRNEAATLIYRRASLLQRPGTDPESLPHIVGPAVLFSRRVWF